MNLKNSFILLQFFSSMLFGFSYTDTSSSANDTIQQLMERVTLLELELDEMKRESVRNPISSRAYKNWGEGLTIAVEYPYLSAELGYTFKIVKKKVRLGFFGGYAMRPNNISNWPASYSESGRHFVYWKIVTGTPVFFNLMSFSGALSQLYSIDESPSFSHSFVDTVHSESDTVHFSAHSGYINATVLSANGEFWISPKMNIFFGINVYFHKFTPYNTYLSYINKDNDIYEYDSGEERWITNNFKIGARYHFGTFRSMAQNAKKRKSKK